MTETYALGLKAWKESRQRFLLIGVVVALFCAAVVLLRPAIQAEGNLIPVGLRSRTYSAHIYNLVYSGTLKGIFAILVIFLGLGGLKRENEYGSAAFTLALPVSRARLVLAQVGVGVFQVGILALVPAVVIPLLSRTVHQTYPLGEALHFAILWFVIGSLWLTMAYLLSVVFSGAYAAAALAVIVMNLHALVAGWGPLAKHRLNLMWTMGEFNTMTVDARTNLLISGPLPALRLAIIALVAATFVLLAIWFTQREEL